MDLKMMLARCGIILMFYLQPVLLNKGLEDDSMEFSSYTFAWEDAESRCLRQGQVLVPGRRFRAKLIKKIMTKENVDAVWLNGWRAVSDITPDKDGKLRTLKVDFSRPQNKELKMVCQMDSLFYDPLYKATSTESARSVCDRDGAYLASVTTEEDVKKITESIVIDSPHWIDSISSRGKSGYFISSKIKQCLVAERAGDDLKYNYEDCSKEYNFICVKDDDIISSFSPLISLKLARFEEFEEEIEKHEQSTMSSSETFDLFSSASFIEEFSSDIPFTTTSTIQPVMSLSEEPVAVASTKISAEESSEITDSIKPSKTSILASPAVTEAEYVTSSSPSVIIDTANMVYSTTSSKVLSDRDIIQASETSSKQEIATRDAVDLMTSSSTAKDIPVISSIIEHKIIEQSSVSTSDAIESLMIDKNYRESIFVDPSDSLDQLFSSSTSDQLFPSSTLDQLFPSRMEPSQESSSMTISQYEQSLVDTYSSDIFDTVSTEPLLQQSTQTFTSQSKPMDYSVTSEHVQPSVDIDFDSVIKEEIFGSVSTEPVFLQTTQINTTPLSSTLFIDFSAVPEVSSQFEISEPVELDETETSSMIDKSVTEEVLVTIIKTTSETQPTNIIVTPTTVQQVMTSDIDILPSDFQPEPVSSSSSVLVDTMSSESEQIPQISDYLTPDYEPTSPTQAFIVSTYTPVHDSKPPRDSIILATSESSATSYECTVIDSTSFCIDTTTATDETQPMTYGMDEFSISSSLSLSSTPSFPKAPSSLYPIYDMDKDIESLISDIPSSVTSTEAPFSSVVDFGYDYKYPDHTVGTDDYDEDTGDEITFSSIAKAGTTTPEYTIGFTDPVKDIYNETDGVDEELPGQLDTEDTDESDNEVGNASADTGNVVEAKSGEDDGGVEVGLWVAFAILITLVLIALILAAYLYRKRKLQKSKDITTAAPAAPGETVELRDSRSPSRENGKPRESATYKDPAYDI